MPTLWLAMLTPFEQPYDAALVRQSHEFDGSVDDALALLRGRMQETLDGINTMLRAGGRLRTYPNPFYRP